ncbi:hypothetical protein K438DRAFT_1673251 [Mycena galopus ATCC 62051]|nr:hypothetical protein K438DRAFT_1673251 [Mycena galopus ATCC 62051]
MLAAHIRTHHVISWRFYSFYSAAKALFPLPHLELYSAPIQFSTLNTPYPFLSTHPFSLGRTGLTKLLMAIPNDALTSLECTLLPSCYSAWNSR